jgi:eukaryotic-like serine/threonine-protein kinase
MPFWSVWLRALGKAIWQEVPQAIAGMIPFGENLYRIGERFYQNLASEQKPDERRTALEQLVAQPQEAIAIVARQIAAEVAPEAPPEIQLRLASTLELAPAVARCSLRRADDPSGQSVPPTLRLDQKGALLPFVPPGPPRFQAGESPQALNGWKLVERLGVGGFAEVWKVCHPDDDHLIAAYKFFLDDPSRSRFGEHEVAVLKQVRRLGTSSATGIVKLEDFNIKTDPLWLRFECIDGGDLVSHAQRFYGAAATSFILELARIVGCCHRLTPPVVHRDIKPSNILLRREDDRLVPLIADFGIGGNSAAETLNQERLATVHRATLPTELLGSHSAQYASPEQRAGRPPDPRDDVYALGVLWYQLLVSNLNVGAPSGNWQKKVSLVGLNPALVELLGSCSDEDRPADATVLAERITLAMGQRQRDKIVPGDRVPAIPSPSAEDEEGMRPESFLPEDAEVDFPEGMQVNLKVSPDEALRLIRTIPHKKCQRAIPNNWRLNEDRKVTHSSVYWLYCWAKTGQNSDKAAQVSRKVFNAIFDVSYTDFDRAVDHESARKKRYQ